MTPTQSQTHPMVPPKSCIEIYSSPPESFTYIETDHPESGKHWITEDNIIAAVAEVEWRKRAERWSRLANRILVRQGQRRWGTTGSLRRTLEPRKQKYLTRMEACHDHADEWRKWANKKDA